MYNKCLSIFDVTEQYESPTIRNHTQSSYIKADTGGYKGLFIHTTLRLSISNSPTFPHINLQISPILRGNTRAGVYHLFSAVLISIAGVFWVHFFICVLNRTVNTHGLQYKVHNVHTQCADGASECRYSVTLKDLAW